MSDLLPPLLAAVAGALIATVGSYFVLVHLAARRHRLAELRQDLYDFLLLATEYWTVPDHPNRALQEARILARQNILTTKFRDLARLSNRMARTLLKTSPHRLDLWRAVTGGKFHSRTAWTPNPQRPRLAAAAVARIIAVLPP